MVMKLRFEPNLDFQLDAIDAVCDLFRGQEVCRTEFTVTRDPVGLQGRLSFDGNDLGIGNRLTLLDEEILQNLNAIQLRNGLRPSDGLDSGDFTVEMETGTGKTYVYLRTIFELNKRLRIYQVRRCRAIHSDQGGCLQIAPDHRGTFPSTLFWDTL